MAGGHRKKEEIITFKVDQPLATIIKSFPNRSEFIRNAVSAALESVCPLCRGTGILSPDQQRHFREFSSEHKISECKQCQAVRLVCIGPGTSEQTTDGGSTR